MNWKSGLLRLNHLACSDMKASLATRAAITTTVSPQGCLVMKASPVTKAVKIAKVKTNKKIT